MNRPLLEPTLDNIQRAKTFMYQKWVERARENGRATPKDLTGACKFGSLFAQRLFGGELEGNWRHQVLRLPNGEWLDLTDQDLPARHDKRFWNNPEHRESLNSCIPRVEKWVEEFLGTVGKKARRTRLATIIIAGDPSEELRVPDGRNNLYSWLDPNGQFYPVGPKSHHSEVAAPHGGVIKLMEKGWGRITWYGPSVYFNSNRPPTRRQLAALRDAAIEGQKTEIVFDNNLTGDDKVLWRRDEQ